MHFFVGFLFFMPAVRTKDARSETCNFVECISKKYPKWNTKKWYAIFCIMKNAAGKQHIHLHIHTYALRRNALHAIALETELSCEIQTQKYILKLKCDCLSKCKQSKGCAGLTHTHRHAYPLHRHTMHRKQMHFCASCRYTKGRPFVGRGCEFRWAPYAVHN